MTKRLRILHLEDQPDYSDLVRDVLAREGIEADVILATNWADFEAALANESFDLILADYLLPSCNGIQALELAQERCPQVPFLMVSGTIGEQAAIESLKVGATDYVLKQTPERLVPAVRRAVQEAKERARRQEIETELVRREKYFRALTENSLDALTILDREGKFVYNSPALLRLAGYEPQEVVGQNAFDLVHPEDLARVQEIFALSLENPQLTPTTAFRFRHKDGTWRHLELVGQNCLADPDIAGIVLNTRDIGERVRAEEELRASEQEYRLLFQGNPNPMWVFDLETLAFLEINDAAIQHYGYSRNEFLSMTLMDLRAPGEEPVLPPGPELPPAGACPGAPAQVRIGRHRTKPGAVIDVELQWSPMVFRGRLAALTLATDITERRRAEQAVRESERRFRELFEASPDAIFVETPEGTVLDVNPAACQLHGLSRELLVGKNVVDLIPPGKWSDQKADEFKRLADGELGWVEGESWTADGRALPVEVRANRIEYGGAPALLLHVRDVSERKLAESALRSSEMLFYSVWENSVDGMRLTDENGVIVAANDAYSNLIGLSRPELESKPFTVIYDSSEDAGEIMEAYRQRFRDRVMERQAERVITLHNSKTMILEETSSYVELRGHPPLLLSLFRDITAQKHLTEQLRQAQKMEAIGQLAGGVAHDFNNILTVIHGHASLLRAAGDLPAPAARSAQQISEAAERAAALTRQLLAFSRRHVMQPQQLDMNVVVGNMTKMLGRILGEDIALQMNYCPQPPLVEGDASMMEQVLLNFGVNSRDAMPKGGQLSLRIKIVDVDGRHVRHHPEARPGRFVCLSAVDTGCGITPENLPHIFEPFFTTKGVGQGTGLGLATVYGVVKQHQGWIEVESEVDQGATFRVYLPYVGKAAATNNRDKTPEPAAQGGTETIMVVEDEKPVRELVCNLLQERGYRVLPADSGAEALDVWRDHESEVDLLLTDLVMPGRMNGRELAEHLCQDRPMLKVLFTSGYSADVVGREFIAQHGRNYLQKPYPPERLASAIRTCLDGSNGPPRSSPVPAS